MNALVPASATGGWPARARSDVESRVRPRPGEGLFQKHADVQSVRSPLTALGVHVTPHWAIRRYMPAYQRERARWGDDYDAVLGDLWHTLAPQAALGPPTSGPERELLRRIDLATAVLFNQDGMPRPLPLSSLPRPLSMTRYGQPWIRALVTGWV